MELAEVPSTSSSTFNVVNSSEISSLLENVVVESQAMLVDSENVLVDSENVVVDSENIIVDSESIVVDSENIIVDSENIVVDSENIVVDSENVVVDSENIVVDSENIVVDSENIVLDSENIVLDSGSIVFGSENIVLDSVVENESVVDESCMDVSEAPHVTSESHAETTSAVTSITVEAPQAVSSTDTTNSIMSMLNLPSVTKDNNSTKIVKPIYLIPNRTGSIALTSASGTTTVNKVLLTSNSSSLAGKPLIVAKSFGDGKSLPIVMKGQYLTGSPFSGTTAGGHIITKVILTTQSLTGQSNTQTMTLAPVSSSAGSSTFLTASGHSVKFVTATAAQSQANMLTFTTAGSALANRTQNVVTVPASSAKPAITVNKVALSPRAPTKIMIPVNMGKSPQKIAPAPSGTPIQLIAKSGGGGNTITATTVPKLNTITGSPAKVIIKQSTASNVDLKSNTLSTVISPSVVSTSSSVTGAVKQIIASTSAGTLGVQPIHVPGSKLSYIRLVTASAAGTTGVRPQTLDSGTVVRPIAPATTLSGGASQVKIALPLTSSSGQIVNRTLVAAPKVGTGQRILIPASSLNSMTQIRPSSGSITVPASALAQLAPGTTLYSSGGNLSNIVMLPAQYVTQLQAQVTQSQTILAAASATITTSASKTPIVIAPSIQSHVDGLPNLSQTFTSAVAISSSSSSHEKGHGQSSRHSLNGKSAPNDSNGVRLRKPCNCTKSQCLKLYCDCFANGEFCHNCNCNNCSNNLEFEEDRQKAIKSCLERNPQAFHPKIVFPQVMRIEGKVKGETDVERRHNKGCNCKRSGCLKNYCECYEAKIMCSYMCKCVGCKNFAESAEKKTLMHLADAAEVRVQQQTAAKSKLSSQMQDVPFKPTFTPTSGERLPSSFITPDVIEATCQCLLAQVEEGKVTHMSDRKIEQIVIQEFGRSLFQVIEYANKTKI